MPTSSLLTSTNTNSNKLDEIDLINHDLDGGGGGGGGGGGDDDRSINTLALQFQNTSIHTNKPTPSTNSAGQTIEDMMILRGLKAPSQNITESVPVPSSEHVAEIVGRQGCKIKALRAKTNTYIKTPVRGEQPMFVITGRKEDVLTAKHEIQLAADHFSQIRARRGSSSSSGSGNGGLSSVNASVLASQETLIERTSPANTEFNKSPSLSPSILITNAANSSNHSGINKLECVINSISPPLIGLNNRLVNYYFDLILTIFLLYSNKWLGQVELSLDHLSIGIFIITNVAHQKLSSLGFFLYLILLQW